MYTHAFAHRTKCTALPQNSFVDHMPWMLRSGTASELLDLEFGQQVKVSSLSLPTFSTLHQQN